MINGCCIREEILLLLISKIDPELHIDQGFSEYAQVDPKVNQAK